MPIGSTNVYYPGDLILSTVSSSGTSFIETKIVASTSSLIYFDNNARINSASLSSFTFGSSSYSLTASYVNISSSNVFVQGGNSFGTTAILGTNDASALSFETNGSTRATIDTNGNLGIGTSSPTQKLDIVGSYAAPGDSSGILKIRGGATGADTQLNFGVSADGGYGWIQGTDVGLTNNINIILNPIGGNVGIGTTSPVNKLDVAGNISCSVMSSSFAYLSNIGFTNQITSSDTTVFPTGSTSGGFILDGGIYTNGLYRTRFVKIDRSANLPLYIQETQGSSGSFANLVRFGTHANSPNTFEVFGRTNIQGSITSSNFVGPHIGNTTGTASWATNALTASFLPVGTYNITSSWANNSISASYAVTASYVNISSSNVFLQGGNSFGTTALLGTNDAQPLVFETSGSERMRIVSDGNVGIGTTSPAFLLDVSGSSRHGFTSTNVHQFTGSVNINGSLFSDANITASNISASGNIIASRITSSNVLINGNLTVTGSIFASLFSASYIYITSSQLVVTDNIITLNALSPYQRYAGIEMYDSGSGNLSSFLWDGQGDYFFVTGSGVNSKIIVGPDQQTNLTSGRLTKATGTNIIGDSIVSDDGSGITVAGYISGSSVMTTNITCSNISASKTGSFGIVGIGTSSPISKLEVSGGYITAGNRTSPQGAIILQGAYDTGNIVVFGSEYSSGGPFLGYGVSPSTASAASFFSSTPASNLGRMAYVQGSDTHRWYVGPTQTVSVGVTASLNEAMRINSAGYVGIGTTNPLSLLELYAKPALTSSLLTMLTINTDLTSSSGTGFGGSITFRGRTAGNLLQDNAQISAYNENINDNGYALGFYTRPTVAAGLIQRVTILRGGNVGIGTTSPAQSLDVSGSIRIRSAGTYSDPTDNAGFLNYDSIGGIFTISARSNSGNTFMAFRTSNGGSASEIMRIDNNGNVGIGTSSPGYKLDVLGDLRISGSTSTIGTFKSSASNCFISLIDSSGDNVFLGNDDGDFLIQTPTSAYSTKLIVKDDGNVGIGTTVPAFLLDVSGSSRHGFTSTNVHQFTGSVSISGSVNLAGSFVYDNAVLLDFGRTTTPAISTNYVVLQNITGSYNAAFFDYFASSGSNFRAGTVIAGWSGSSINYTEYSTTDIGNTNQLTMSVDLSSSFVRLLTTVSTTTNWNIKSSGRYL